VQRPLSIIGHSNAAFAGLDPDPFVLFRVIEVLRHSIIGLQY
jgi:hypothetical protein